MHVLYNYQIQELFKILLESYKKKNDYIYWLNYYFLIFQRILF